MWMSDAYRMIKKIIIIGLVIIGMYFFYKKFMADTLGDFFQKQKNNVDFFGTLSNDKTHDALRNR